MNRLGIRNFLRVSVVALASLATAAVGLGVSTPPAGAGSFPGPNGRIVFLYATNFFENCCQFVSVRPDGTGRQTLTDFGPYFQPSWSPNGELITFEFDSDTAAEIRIMDASGGNVKTVVPTGCNSYPTFSPDGEQLVFVNWPGPDYPDCFDNNPDLFIVNVDGTGLHQLTTTPNKREIMPEWSSTGSRITYTAQTDFQGNFSIYTIRPDGTGTKRITPHRIVSLEPDWSPDARWITFTGFTTHGRIYVVHPDGTGLKALTNAPALLNDLEPAFSPDGKKITFSSDRLFDEDFDLFVMNADGSGIHRIVNNGPGYNFIDVPDWGTNQSSTPSTPAVDSAGGASIAPPFHPSSGVNYGRLRGKDDTIPGVRWS